MIYAVVALAVSLSTVVGYGYLPWRRMHKKFVVIGLKSGATVDGFLMSRFGSLVHLKNARRFTPKGELLGIDGDYTLERREIEGYQYNHDREVIG